MIMNFDKKRLYSLFGHWNVKLSSDILLLENRLAIGSDFYLF